MQVKFRIGKTLEIKDKVYVFAELVEKNYKFKLSNNSFLGEIAIENRMEIPKALDKNGKQRYDLFVFVLKDKNDRHKLKQFDIVVLKS